MHLKLPREVLGTAQTSTAGTLPPPKLGPGPGPQCPVKAQPAPSLRREYKSLRPHLSQRAPQPGLLPKLQPVAQLLLQKMLPDAEEPPKIPLYTLNLYLEVLYVLGTVTAPLL